MKIGIIGGTDGLGLTLAKLLKNKGFNISITGTDKNKGIKLANNLGLDYIIENQKLASESDIVIISVPINYTCKVIKEVSNYMKKGSLMIDVTSVKEKPKEAMEKYLPEYIEFIPTHPIFGPRTQDFDNQLIVLTTKYNGKWYPKVYNFLKNENMRIIETSAEKHDYMMAIVQVLTHFSYISAASAFEKLKVNIKETEDFESPIYNLMIDMIARIVSQNPYLTYYIQTMNKNGEKIRKALSDAVLELEEVINSKNEEKFVEIAIKATKNMGDIQEALGRSDKAINSLNYEINKLYNSINKEIALKHIYSKTVHIGVLKKVNPKFITLIDENDKEINLKVSNIEFLSEEKLMKWKISNFKRKVESISVIFLEDVNKEIIKETILKQKGITDVKIKDIYTGPQIKKGFISITFEVESLSKENIDNVKKLLKGFGGKIR